MEKVWDHMARSFRFKKVSEDRSKQRTKLISRKYDTGCVNSGAYDDQLWIIRTTRKELIMVAQHKPHDLIIGEEVKFKRKVFQRHDGTTYARACELELITERGRWHKYDHTRGRVGDLKWKHPMGHPRYQRSY